MNREFNYTSLAKGVGLCVLALLLFSVVQYSSSSLLGTDGYYHSKLSLIMSQVPVWNWPVDFPWLPKTVLSPERYHDHHFLYHAFLSPFVSVSLLDGAKFAAVVMPALALLAFFYAAPQLSWFTRLLVVLGFFALSPDFLFRMSMVRAQSLSLVLLLLLFGSFRREKVFQIFVISFIYVWSYNAFPLAVLICGSWAFAKFVRERKVPLGISIACLLGILQGLVINPYFPNNVAFLFHHLVDKIQLSGYTTAVGNEWYPFSGVNFLGNLSIPLVLFASSVFIYVQKQKLPKQEVLTLMLVTLVFLVMTFKARRFVELAPVFALLCFVTAVVEVRLLSWAHSTRYLKLFSLGAISFCSYLVVSAACDSARDSKSYESFADSMQWLQKNTGKGELVFNADWDDFPRLFHFNHHNTYLVGLDPYFLFAEDRAGFNLWVKITKGKTKGPLGKLILKRFGTEYIFLDRHHRGFKKNLEKDPTIKRVFKGKDSYIYKIEA